MGRRRGRPTRSDAGGRGRPLGGGWPEFEHNQWTFEGRWERVGAFATGLRRIQERGGRRAITNRDLVVPILVTTGLFLVLVVAVGAVLAVVF